jgi:hypothetical protein
MSTSNRAAGSRPGTGPAREPLTGYTGSLEDQFTLVLRILEGGERTPGVTVHDYSVTEPGEAGNAILIYSIACPRSAVTYWQQQDVKALPLYDGTVWSITLQTFKAAQEARARQVAMEGELTTLQAELDAARARITELEEGTPR